MQMQVNCHNLERTQDTTHHAQIDGFLKNWGRKRKSIDSSGVSHHRFKLAIAWYWFQSELLATVNYFDMLESWNVGKQEDKIPKPVVLHLWLPVLPCFQLETKFHQVSRSWVSQWHLRSWQPESQITSLDADIPKSFSHSRLLLTTATFQ